MYTKANLSFIKGNLKFYLHLLSETWNFIFFQLSTESSTPKFKIILTVSLVLNIESLS